jgi:hypothetical protein
MTDSLALTVFSGFVDMRAFYIKKAERESSAKEKPLLEPIWILGPGT